MAPRGEMAAASRGARRGQCPKFSGTGFPREVAFRFHAVTRQPVHKIAETPTPGTRVLQAANSGYDGRRQNEPNPGPWGCDPLTLYRSMGSMGTGRSRKIGFVSQKYTFSRPHPSGPQLISHIPFTIFHASPMSNNRTHHYRFPIVRQEKSCSRESHSRTSLAAKRFRGYKKLPPSGGGAKMHPFAARCEMTSNHIGTCRQTRACLRNEALVDCHLRLRGERWREARQRNKTAGGI